MDLGKLAQSLIDSHAAEAKRLTPVLRGTAISNYKKGVEDCLRLMQVAAVSAESVAQELTAPLAVQASHAALPVPEGK